MKDTNKTKNQLIDELANLRKQIAELEIVESEHRQLIDRLKLIAAAAEQSTEGIAVSDLEGNLLFVNKAFAAMHGYAPEDIVGRHLSIFHTSEQMPSVNEANRKIRQTGSFSGEIWHARSDGTVFPTLMQNSILRDQGGNPVGMIGTVRDITERLRVEAGLRNSEREYRNLVNTALVGIFKTSINGDILYVNDALTSLLEHDSPEDLKSMNVISTYRDPKQRDSYINILKRNGRVVGHEAELLTKSGTTKKVLVSAVLEQETISGMMMDITEREKMEDELRQNEERFRALFEGSLDGVFLGDPESGIIFDANPAASDLLLLKREEILGLHYTQVHPPRFHAYAKEMWARIVEDKEELPRFEILALRSDGAEIPVELVAQLIQINGVPVVHANFHDISRRKEVENALRESEERYRSLFEESPIALWEVDSSYPKRYVDKLRGKGIRDFRAYFRNHPEELIDCMKNVKTTAINNTTLELYKAKSKKAFLDALGKIITKDFCEEFLEEIIAVAEGKTVFQREIVTPTFTGEEKHIQYRCSVAPGFENTFSKVLVSITDITERRQLEQELLKTQKLESLGLLAGGIAHDFNNLLTAISTNIAMARMYGNLDDDISQMLRDAEKASLRATNLTQQLLAFAKGGKPIKKVVSLSRILKDAVEFALSGSNVQGEYSIPEDLWSVSVDEGQIGQVIHNLAVNADQAMPEGGTIEIVAKNIVVGEKDQVPLRQGKYTKVSVTDHGMGISKKHLEKVFDPFFTTKQKGRGLGLTTSFTIVKNHGGHIRVHSEVDIGTTVDIYLPASDEPIEKRTSEKETPALGEGRVLLIDDEEIIRRSGSEMLKRLGYDVKVAKDGAEGVEFYKQATESGRPFDVVIMDLTIRGAIGGKDAMQHLLRTDPDVKAIVSSGYSDDPVMSDFKEYGFRGVIMKPYRIQEVAETLRKVVAGEDR